MKHFLSLSLGQHKIGQEGNTKQIQNNIKHYNPVQKMNELINIILKKDEHQ